MTNRMTPVKVDTPWRASHVRSGRSARARSGEGRLAASKVARHWPGSKTGAPDLPDTATPGPPQSDRQAQEVAPTQSEPGSSHCIPNAASRLLHPQRAQSIAPSAGDADTTASNTSRPRAHATAYSRPDRARDPAPRARPAGERRIDRPPARRRVRPRIRCSASVALTSSASRALRGTGSRSRKGWRIS